MYGVGLSAKEGGQVLIHCLCLLLERIPLSASRVSVIPFIEHLIYGSSWVEWWAFKKACPHLGPQPLWM